jgi:hypothetical protein
VNYSIVNTALECLVMTSTCYVRAGWFWIVLAVVALLLLGMRVDEASMNRVAVKTAVRGAAGRQSPPNNGRADYSASDASAYAQPYPLQPVAAAELTDQLARGAGMQSCFDSTLPAEFASPVSRLTLEQKVALHKSIPWAPLAGADALAMLRPKELRLIGLAPANMSKWNKCDKQNHDMPTAGVGNQCGCGSTEFSTHPIQYPHRVLRDNRPAAKLGASASRTYALPRG